MKVYGVYCGYDYDGGGTGNTLYATKELARRAALEEVAFRQKETEKMRSYRDGKSDNLKRTLEMYPDWKEIEEGYWRGNMESVRVMEFTVVGKADK